MGLVALGVRYCTLGPWVIISRMFINDNILFNSKRNIIDNSRLSLRTPLRSTHGGSFELPNTVKVLHGLPRTVWRSGIGVLPTQHLGAIRPM